MGLRHSAQDLLIDDAAEEFMIIDKDVFEAMLMFLYNTHEFEACEALFEVYKKQFFSELTPKVEATV